MKILSLFDGISCGRVAIERAGIKVDKYYASEIDKYAIQITQKNYPDTIQLGDVNNYENWDIDWDSIDLLIGGSPCQDLSIANKERKGLEGQRSSLFWKYVEILQKAKPKYFLLENVASMPKEAKEIITETLGVEPILINSALVSAQQRKRLYWTNIQNITQPEDKGIVLKDILISGEPYTDKSYLINATYNNANTTEKGVAYSIEKSQRTLVVEPVRVGHIGESSGQANRLYSVDGKSVCLQSGAGGSGAKTGLYAVPKYCNDSNLETLMRPFGSKAQIVTDNDDKAPTIIAAMGCGGGNGIYYAEQNANTDKIYKVENGFIYIKEKAYKIKLPDGYYAIRKLYPIECERLQTLPDNYTEGVSNSQRYKAIGNGWTVDVIAHIFSSIPSEY